MRTTFNLLAISVTLIWVILVLVPTTNGPWLMLAVAGAAAFFGNLDRIERITIGKGSIEAVTRDLREAQVELRNIRDIVVVLSEAIVASAEGNRVFGGAPDSLWVPARERLIELLHKLDVGKEKIEAVVRISNLMTKYEYVHEILGEIKSDDIPQSLRTQWEKIRPQGINSIASASEVRAFLEAYGVLEKGYKEMVDDYEYFEKHGEHRRPERWVIRDWP